ncbi:hypothetical protein [Cellulosilyticum ruminicola]|nr:hypothetical protein [Cellulosilyticum ruminicola]
MTRRLDPMDRMDELEDASVAFNFVKTIDFVKTAPAEQYRESLKLKQITQ